MEERLRILELIEAGEIGVEEGARRLEALAEAAEPQGSPAAPALSTVEGPALSPSTEFGVNSTEGPALSTAEGPALSTAEGPAVSTARPAWVRWLWQAVFWTGVGLAAGGGLLLVSSYAEEVATGWLTWGWILFVLGVLGVLLGWWLQQAPWFSLRVRQSGGPNIFFALPLPLGPVAWLLRVAHPFAPQLEEMRIDELVLAMRDQARDGRPFTVEVDEGEDGERVQIYFG